MATPTTTKVSKRHPAIWTILRLTFPQYKGRTVKVVSGPSTVIGCLHDGGATVRRARIVSLRTMGVIYVHDTRFDLPTDGDHLIVTHDRFCGKDMGITIYVHAGLAEADLAVLVDALLQSATPSDPNRSPASALCHRLFQDGGAAWGSYDKGFEKVTPLDLAWAVAQDTVDHLRTEESRAKYNYERVEQLRKERTP